MDWRSPKGHTSYLNLRPQSTELSVHNLNGTDPAA
jgi:hypothetical protein